MDNNNIQHPCHRHRLKLVDTVGPGCRHCCICGGPPNKAFPAYSCKQCRVFTHKPCAELPSPLLRHPFHLDHPLTLVHGHPRFKCSHCGIHFENISKYSCTDCGFDLEPQCAAQGIAGNTSRSLLNDLHDHPLNQYSHTGYPDFCCLCDKGMGGKSYMCSERQCSFMFHEKCVPRLFYEDRSRIPRVEHKHQLITFHSKGKSSHCRNCDSAISGETEYIGCPRCQLFYHRKCVEAPDSLNPQPHCHHSLTLSIAENLKRVRKIDCLCRSCGIDLLNQVVYSCSTCQLNLHIGCARCTEDSHQKKADSVINIPWHKHSLRLYDTSNISKGSCSACRDYVDGRAYLCSVNKCDLLLHESCAELKPEMEHGHHPRHPLVLVPEASNQLYDCDACHREISGFRFSCSDCDSHLDISCASKDPFLRHVLHEHKLTCFEKLPTMQCNVCGQRNHSVLYRCVPCDFNIHQECMDLPKTVRHKSHLYDSPLHTLVLQDSYVEDDWGEYHCEICGERRNPNLGVYVCSGCKSDNPFIAHMGCALSKKMFLRMSVDPKIRKMDLKITDLERRLQELKVVKEKLEETRKEHDELISEEKFRNSLHPKISN